MSQTVLTCTYKNGTLTSIEKCYNPHLLIEFALLFIISILLLCYLRLYCSSPVPYSDDFEEPSYSSNQRVTRDYPQYLAHPSVYISTFV